MRGRLVVWLLWLVAWPYACFLSIERREAARCQTGDYSPDPGCLESTIVTGLALLLVIVGATCLLAGLWLWGAVLIFPQVISLVLLLLDMGKLLQEIEQRRDYLDE